MKVFDREFMHAAGLDQVHACLISEDFLTDQSRPLGGTSILRVPVGALTVDGSLTATGASDC